MVDRLMREIEKKEEEHKLEQWKLQYDMNKKCKHKLCTLYVSDAEISHTLKQNIWYYIR